MKYLLVCDLDDTLTGNKEGIKKFNETITDADLSLAYSSGRFMESMKCLISSLGLVKPNVIVANLGTEIYYGPNWTKDEKWEKTIKKDWKKEKIISVLDDFELQAQPYDKKLVVSYYTENKDVVKELKKKMEKYNSKVVHTKNKFLDIIPKKAGKGNAARYLGDKMKSRIVCCGDSENDEEMLLKSDYGILVGNSPPILQKKMVMCPHVYVANSFHATGVIEGLMHKGIISIKNEGSN